MADLTNEPITEDGNYDFPATSGEEHLALIYRAEDCTGTLALYYEHPARKARGEAETWAPTGIVFDLATATTEDLNFPFLGCGSMRWVLTGATTDELDISVTPVLR